MLADHTIESARNAGADFYLQEDRSGVFTLGRTGKGLPVNAKHMRIFCPWHETNEHPLQAIDSNTLVCTECDPRLKNLYNRRIYHVHIFGLQQSISEPNPL